MTKPYLPPEDLLQRLRSLGMEIASDEEGVLALARHGYHRLGGYRYPFREMLPESLQDETSRKFRYEHYVPGTTLQAVVDLADFDDHLRIVLLAGLLDFEVRLRVAITEALGPHGSTAHLDITALDSAQCARKTKQGETRFAAWKNTCEAAIRFAHDDFVTHHLETYPGEPVPVWCAVDLVSFGALPHLLELMKAHDRHDVALSFGLPHDATFTATVWQLVDLRNVCAHGQRVYNRFMKRPVRYKDDFLEQPPGSGNMLSHFSEIPVTTRRKLYPIVALLAYLLRSHQASSLWHSAFKAQVRELEKIRLNGQPAQSPELHMGFPTDWEELELWN